MGLFKKGSTGFGKESAGRGNSEVISLSELERELIQAVALTMHSMKITAMPVLRFLKSDRGLFEGIFESHMRDPNVQAIKKQYPEMYLTMLGGHALGGGTYVTLSQGTYGKAVEEFTLDEVQEIANNFRETDPYELGIKSMGYGLESNNKKCLDAIILNAEDVFKELSGPNAHEPAYLKVYMQTLYNAGVTLVLR